MPHNPTLTEQRGRESFSPTTSRQQTRFGERTRPLRLAALVVTTALIVVGAWFRVWRLDRVPGLNGDEAWSGVQALKFLHGESVSWQTPTGNPLNVFFLGPLVALHAMLP